ncbi:MAG: TolC family protein [Candidatus Aminicenantes bacterium]|nr:TolC family protein [Candidatus Aminicenantes bacterium]
MKKAAWIIIVGLCAQAVYAQRPLTLEESKRLALQNNGLMKNSDLETEAARQARKAAFTSYFPTISASGFSFDAQKALMEMTSSGGNLPVYNGNPATLPLATQFAYFPSTTTGLLKSATMGMINVVQPVFAGGRIVNGNKLASLGVEAGEYKTDLLRNDILLKTEEQYWLLVSLEEKLKTIGTYEAFLDSLLRQVEDAYAAGLVMKNDVLKVKIKRSELLVNKSKAENGKNLALMAFCQHLGIPFDPAMALTDSLTSAIPDLPAHVEAAQAVKTRPEFKLLGASVRAEELQSRMKLGEFLPQVAVGLSGLYTKSDEQKGRTIGLVYGTISIPISGWWQAAHALKERRIREQIAGNSLTNNSELLLLQMEKAWQDLSDAHRQVLLSRETKAQAEENLKVNQDGYANGMIGVSDWLEAQALRQQADDQWTEALAAYRVKRMTYLQVTGR